MADLAQSEFRTVIEDARVRHAGIVLLIQATDTQALGLLRLYVTLAIATSSGAVATLGSSLQFKGALVTALISILIAVGIGSAFCLRALQGGAISVPGRTPDFWLWALDADVTEKSALEEYLKSLQTKIQLNRALNIKTTNALTWAKRCGLAAPFLGLIAGLGYTVGSS